MWSGFSEYARGSHGRCLPVRRDYLLSKRLRVQSLQELRIPMIIIRIIHHPSIHPSSIHPFVVLQAASSLGADRAFQQDGVETSNEQGEESQTSCKQPVMRKQESALTFGYNNSPTLVDRKKQADTTRNPGPQQEVWPRGAPPAIPLTAACEYFCKDSNLMVIRYGESE
ncbi:hypothetical protein D4764_17G0001810 [Takifugu flavidus]|uniref:Uncharacterized protein n=1 Tax=Takifugu flavidus TaxID=433684 RepID=A0A5C6NV48_9TELE|nr:hypothetical protein D4764_17G0001810 [Takifugu flavidus]